MMQPDTTSSVHRGDSVRIQQTPVGKGVFAERGYPSNALIGEIKGDLVSGSEIQNGYAFEIDEHTQLNPHAPFRYLNHHCTPNCEFDWDDEVADGEAAPIYLFALRDIALGEELTIDYNWPSSAAIPCRCDAASCRGWIVNIDELDQCLARSN